jgi:hypothetical protein
VLLALSLVLAASPLDDARRAYADLDYETCVKTLGTLRNVPARDRAQGELLLGLCHFALGHESQARTRIESALRRSPKLVAPADASPKEKALVEEVRAVVAASPGAARAKKGPRKADAAVEPGVDGASVAEGAPGASSPGEGTPPVVVGAAAPAPPAAPETTSPPPDAPVARSIAPDAALTPPPPTVVTPAPARGLWAPWVAGGVAVAAAGVGVGFGLNARGLESSARAEPVQVDAERLRAEAQTSATVANVAFAVAGTAAVTALVTWLVLR